MLRLGFREGGGPTGWRPGGEPRAWGWPAGFQAAGAWLRPSVGDRDQRPTARAQYWQPGGDRGRPLTAGAQSRQPNGDRGRLPTGNACVARWAACGRAASLGFANAQPRSVDRGCLPTPGAAVARVTTGLWRAAAFQAAAAIAAIAAAAALVGCSGGLRSDAPATQVYVLRAAAHPQAPTKAATASLHVSRPMAAPGLDSDHIVLVQPDHKMSYYIASRWPADLPSVVESLAVDTLRTSGEWSTVQDSGSAFSSDYMLQIVIRRFEADYSAGTIPEIHIVLDCTVGRRAGREVISSFVAEGSSTAAANRLGEVVGAFEEAVNHAMADIASRTAQAVQNQKVEAPVPSITR